MTDMELKGFGAFEIKNEESGEVEAIVATLNEVDRDQDVFLPGSIAEGSPVVLSDYDHSVVLKRERPAGKGAIHLVGDKAVLKGQFFLGTILGRDAFERVKGMGSDGQWSLGFKTTKALAPTAEWQTKGARRLIAETKIWETSPVLVGAQFGTTTLNVKNEKPAHQPNVLRCGCGRVLGESPEPMLFVGKAAELAEVKAPLPRDVRFCKKCGEFAVYLPTASLTGKAA